MPPRKKPASSDRYTDFVQPFLMDHSAIRGRLVRLEHTLDAILTAHNYPLQVSLHLAEQIVIAALLSATLEKDGILTVQTKGDGAVKFMVADIMAGGTIRGCAEADDASLKKILGRSKAKKPLSQIMGKGYLAVTLDQGGEEQRYQGIVELKGKTVSEAFQEYFVQSQQAEIALHVTVRAPDAKHKSWSAGGMIIERMPLEGGKETDFTPEEQDQIWLRTGLFMRTLQDEELLDSDVTPQNLLYRLFNEDGVWVYKLQQLKAGCRCSRARVKTVLQSIAESELLSVLNNDRLSIHCQFCNKTEVFTKAQVKQLYRKPVKRGK